MHVVCHGVVVPAARLGFRAGGSIKPARMNTQALSHGMASQVRYSGSEPQLSGFFLLYDATTSWSTPQLEPVMMYRNEGSICSNPVVVSELRKHLVLEMHRAASPKSAPYSRIVMRWQQARGSKWCSAH